MSTEKGYYNKYNLQELKEKNPIYDHHYAESKPLEDQPNDDKLKSKAWSNAYKSAAYYLDNPTMNHRVNTLNRFRFNFQDLLTQTKNPSELPDLRSRTSFVSWVCKKHNEFLEVKNSDVMMDCSDTSKLISLYGPNYSRVKEFLGEHDFYL
jgi:hypothetical protein